MWDWASNFWEWLTSDAVRDVAGASTVWIVTISLMVVGLAGCVIPALPGHIVILAGAIAYRWMAGPESGIRWWSFLVLVLLLAISQAIEMVSGAAGAKWFGGSKWGSVGAIVGALVGMFFFPVGLFVGPLAGAVAFEMLFEKKETQPAMMSGVGSLAGTLVGMVVKIIFGVLMIAWFFADVFWIG